MPHQAFGRFRQAARRRPALYPHGPQRAALARAFGCARVMFNNALRNHK
ncbi:helix-turn-helix domain-containing protein [Streptomyces sp. NPDC059680]